jgi:hypothetical protein
MYRDSCGHTLNRLAPGNFAVTLLVLLGYLLFVQDILALSSGTSAADGSAISAQPLTVSGPTAIDYSSSYPSANVVSLSVTTQAALPAATLNNSSISTCAVTLIGPNPTLITRPSVEIAASATPATLRASLTAAYNRSPAMPGSARGVPAALRAALQISLLEQPIAELTPWQCYPSANP